MTARPIDVVRERLTIVYGAPPKMRAQCPVHGSRGGTLSISELSDHVVLLKCHAGCSADAILRAIGLTMKSLFPVSSALRDRAQERSAFRVESPVHQRRLVRAAISRGLEQTRLRLRLELGFDRPLRASDLNSIRASINAIYGTRLAPLPAARWEGWAPHDTDPLWPMLYERQLRNVMITKYSDPEAEPSGNDLYLAAIWASRDLREIAESELPG
jgi:hypothetical protein